MCVCVCVFEMCVTRDGGLWSGMSFCFSFLLFQLFDALFNFLRLSHSDALLQFSTSVEYLLICAICTNSFVVFSIFFAFYCQSEHRFLVYVCLYRDILPVSPGFHVFHKFSISFGFRYN